MTDAPGLQQNQANTSDAPMLSRKPNLKRLGKRQKEFLHWVIEQSEHFPDGWIPYIDVWRWMRDRLGYSSGSKSEMARLHPFISMSTFSLVKPLLLRNILIGKYEDSEQELKAWYVEKKDDNEIKFTKWIKLVVDQELIPKLPEKE